MVKMFMNGFRPLIVYMKCNLSTSRILNSHPALIENFYKDIPLIPASRLTQVSSAFGLSEVSDFAPEGDRMGKSISWANISRAVLTRDNYECRICGKSSLSQVESSQEFNKIHFELEVHHIIPRKDGGRDTFRNLITLCEDCHHRTFSNGYAGIPVDKGLDLFSFEKRLMFILPQEVAEHFAGEKRHGVLPDFERVFDPGESSYRIVPMEYARLEVSIAPLTIEQYRGLVSGIVDTYGVKDYATVVARISRNDVRARVLVDSRGDPIA